MGLNGDRVEGGDRLGKFLVGDRVQLVFFRTAEMFKNCYVCIAITPFSQAIADYIRRMLIAAEDKEFGVWVEGGAEKCRISTTKAEGFHFCAGPAEARSGQSEGGKIWDYLHFWQGNRSQQCGGDAVTEWIAASENANRLAAMGEEFIDGALNG